MQLSVFIFWYFIFFQVFVVSEGMDRKKRYGGVGNCNKIAFGFSSRLVCISSE